MSSAPISPQRQNDSTSGALPDGEGCPTLVLSPEAMNAGRCRVSAQVHEGEELADLRAWVRRYVALVIEADAVARACETGGEEAA